MRTLIVRLVNAALWFFLFIFLIVVVIDRHVAYYMSDAAVPSLPNIVLVLLLAVASYGVYRCLGRSERRMSSLRSLRDAHPKALIVAPLALFAVQCGVYLLSGVNTGWDAHEVASIALVPAPLSEHFDLFWSTYVARYPNNHFIIWCLRMIEALRATLFPFANPYTVFALVACFATSLSFGLFMRLSSALLSDVRAELCADIVYVLLICCSPWFMIPYTDTFGLCLCTIVLWCLVCVRNPWAKWALVGFFGIIGYAIKPTAIFCLAAAVVASAAVRLSPAKLKSAALSGLCLVAGIALAGLVVSSAKASLHVTWEPEAEFTIDHYLMMGLNRETDGSFHDPDVEFTASQPDVETRKMANRQVAAQRLGDFGVGGLAGHLLRKLLLNYNDGTFSWGVEGGFYDFARPTTGWLADLLRSVYYSSSPSYGVFRTLQQLLWIMVLGLIPCTLLGVRGSKGARMLDDDKLVALATMLASIVGVTIFLLIFEARARYLFLYGAFFVLLAGNGMQALLAYAEGRSS